MEWTGTELADSSAKVRLGCERFNGLKSDLDGVFSDRVKAACFTPVLLLPEQQSCRGHGRNGTKLVAMRPDEEKSSKLVKGWRWL